MVGESFEGDLGVLEVVGVEDEIGGGVESQSLALGYGWGDDDTFGVELVLFDLTVDVFQGLSYLNHLKSKPVRSGHGTLALGGSWKYS